MPPDAVELRTADLELIHALQIAPRATWGGLGRILGRHPATLAAQWESLRKSGLAWVTGQLSVLPDRGCAAFIRLECRPGQRSTVVERLCALPAISTVDELADVWDVRLTVLAPTWQTLSRETLAQLREDPDVLRVQLAVVTRVHALDNHWRLNVLPPERVRLVEALRPKVAGASGTAPPRLQNMMTVVSRNGRATPADIAAAAGVHPSTAARNLRRATETGLLTLGCEVAQGYSGYGVACQWYARVPQEQVETAVAYLCSLHTLRLCASTTGSSNLVFNLWLRSPKDIFDAEAGFQAAVPEIQIMESVIGAHTHKRAGWLLNRDSTSTGIVVV